MLTIAIFGATSQIASDLVISMSGSYELLLYARDINKLNGWLIRHDLAGRFGVFSLFSYGEIDHDVVINFVGVGDPAKAALMGDSIFEATHYYDQIITNELKKNPTRKYIFLSSGAVYGSDFSIPANSQKQSTVSVNAFDSSQYYTVAKLYAECLHRSHQALNVIDLRVFNYFSSSNNLDSRFFITDILRSIGTDTLLVTSAKDITRDYIHPSDFFQLIDCIIKSPGMNMAVDCYSACVVTKYELLHLFSEKYGLKYKYDENFDAVNATGQKDNYYSEYKIAAEFGYRPQHTSISGVELEASKLLIWQQG
ncbi:NAD-dependent epimerase/dehydratase family protein [Pseudomonadales bacterium]|nr:NAD-dependent epimerase/dehydratase family protein [Pseudomonadales bacterium]